MTVHISYVSDVLCVWAYVAEARLDELRREYGETAELEYHFIPVFGATGHRIGVGWKDRGGFAGFGAHVRSVAEGFPHVVVNERVWDEVRPTTSGAAHEVLCAVRLLVEEKKVDPESKTEFLGKTTFEEAAWRVRCGFFEEAKDISNRTVLFELLEGLGLPMADLEEAIGSGRAMAEVCRDIELRDQLKIEGSPTYYLNQGRQKLYGNVGYRVVSANLRELLSTPGDQASWC
ncbi:MAG: disulfide bond formation protein DsbA [Myxococcota bacterium]